MLKFLKSLFRHQNETNITWFVSGKVKDYDLLSNHGGTVLILENGTNKTGRYYINRHIHDIRKSHPVGSIIRLSLSGKTIMTDNTYLANLVG